MYLTRRCSTSRSTFPRYFCSSHAITSDVSLLETVKAAEFFLADGIILTGRATGEEADVQDLAGAFSDIR